MPGLRFSLLSLLLPLAHAYLVSPDGTPAPGSNQDCSKWVQDSYGLTCAIVEQYFGLSSSEFESWNPSTTQQGSCTMIGGLYYCVEINYQSHSTLSTSPPSTITKEPSVKPTKTTLITTTSSSSGNGITTPTPYQSGMATNCNSFHLVQSGDQCGVIASSAGISLSQFYQWNPAVGSQCQSLYLGDYVCTGVIGSTPTSSPPTTTTTGNGITTPTPYQSGMASNCNKFHLVASGDQCGSIASSAGITLNQFYSWNPAVGTQCQSLGLGDYVCIDVIGVTPTTTSTGNGISTPTPYQTGMASNCDAFHLVASGDQCGTIASAAGISLNQFYSWNPAVGSQCQSLYLGDYVCIDVVGVTPTKVTPTKTSGNGVTTPTPYQSGMTGNCNKFYLVKSGDTCAAITSNNNISLNQFYSWNPAVGTSCQSLGLGDYVCIGTM